VRVASVRANLRLKGVEDSGPWDTSVDFPSRPSRQFEFQVDHRVRAACCLRVQATSTGASARRSWVHSAKDIPQLRLAPCHLASGGRVWAVETTTMPRGVSGTVRTMSDPSSRLLTAFQLSYVFDEERTGLSPHRMLTDDQRHWTAWSFMRQSALLRAKSSQAPICLTALGLGSRATRVLDPIRPSVRPATV